MILAAAPLSAQTYPNRPITFVVPFAAGGLSRCAGARAGRRDAGADRRLDRGREQDRRVGRDRRDPCLRAEPDGYTLLVNALADVQNLHYLPVPYDPIKDFALIGMVTDGPPLVLIVNANLPYKSVAELIADAKANPTKMSFGTSGPATSPAIAVTQLNALAGTRIVDVPYRGSGQAAAAVVTGAVQGAFTFYSSAKPLREDGKVRALAVASPQRIGELARGPDHGASSAFPASTTAASSASRRPPRRRRRSSPSSTSTSTTPSIPSCSAQRMEPLGMTIPTDNTPEKFAEFMRARDRAAGRARQALRPFADGAEAMKRRESE